MAAGLSSPHHAQAGARHVRKALLHAEREVAALAQRSLTRRCGTLRVCTLSHGALTKACKEARKEAGHQQRLYTVVPCPCTRSASHAVAG